MDAFDFADCNTFEVFISRRLFRRLEEVAFRQGVTISWIIRHLLENPHDIALPRQLRRPKKFLVPMHRFPVCFYGEDKRLWKMKAAGLECELGSLIRFLLDYYEQYLDQLWHAGGTVRHSEDLKIFTETSYQRHIGYGYHYLMFVPEKRFYVNENISPTNNRKKMLFGIYKRRFTTRQIKKMVKSEIYNPLGVPKSSEPTINQTNL